VDAARNRFMTMIPETAGVGCRERAALDYRERRCARCRATKALTLGQARGATALLYSRASLSSTSRQDSMATTTKAKKKTVRSASGLKRVRQDELLNAGNTALRSKFRTVVKNVQKAVASGDKAKAAELFKLAQPVIDSVADKGIFHKNKAARHKSRLSAQVKALATQAPRV